jgi:universal stress protein A
MKVKPARDPGGVAIELGIDEPAIPCEFGFATTAPTLFKIKRILVPVDFSECSEKALQYAVAFARQFDAQLILLNVVPRYPQVPELAVMELESAEDVKKRFEVLRDLIGETVPTEAVVRLGDPSLEIVAAARELEIDLIILATHGRTGLNHLFQGSTAEKVVRRACCPVLIVKEREREFIGSAALRGTKTL